MNDDAPDAERLGDLRRVLPAGAAEAAQREARDVVAALHRDLLDRVRHALDGDAQEPGRELLEPRRLARSRRDGRARASTNAFRVASASSGSSALAPNTRGKNSGWMRPSSTFASVTVERPAVPVARGPRVGARGLRADLEPALAERQDRAAAGRDRLDAQHRRADAHLRDHGVRRALELAGVERDVRRRAAHVEADDLGATDGARRAHHADDAAGRPRQQAVLAAEVLRRRETAVALHELERRTPPLASSPRRTLAT